MKTQRRFIQWALLTCIGLGATPLAAQTLTGTDVLTRMHGKTAPAGASLRIDIGSLADGNGTMYPADSSWNVRGGKAGVGNANGNQFISLIENVYLQPIALTIRQLEPQHIDLTQAVDVTWQGRPAWAVAAESSSDTASPQF